MEEKSTLIFQRTKGFQDAMRNYSILVDGHTVGEIGKDSEISISVDAGKHILEAKIDWGRSKPLEINIKDNETQRFLVENSGQFSTLYSITFGRKSYLQIVKIS
ncbi:hypothetical protein [Ralstonia pseudosolanacearum]|uniref:hypothetical protein n=1 Tax=Ralstonia pseudosolanacearum TaxID=1310165 RepID=UPI003CE82264